MPIPSHINLRARALFVEHVRLAPGGAIDGTPVTNVVHRAKGPEEKWIEEANGSIGDWRSLLRSVYLRWAITINASAMAEQRYRDIPQDRALQTTTLRMVDGHPEIVPLAVWPAREAADRYALATPLIAAHGVADLFGAIEDVVFDFYEIFLRHHPEPLTRGDEHRELRRLWRLRDESNEARAAWEAAWSARFDRWRRKRTYDGLHEVLRALFTHAGLRRPGAYRLTDIEDWCRTLEMIGELRHHVVHGAATVSEKLGRLSNTQTSLTFDFVQGDPLDVKLHHLQSVECFGDQLLSAVNISLLEKAIGPLAGPAGERAGGAS